jgi:hypothetical protein
MTTTTQSSIRKTLEEALSTELKETDATIAARVTVRLTAVEWETIKAAVNYGGVLPPDSSRNLLMGYEYALHRHGKCLQQER